METLKIGIITDGKYGERAFENIKKRFDSTWITVPEIPSNVILDDELKLDIPLCDLYISYVRHPDVILQLAELQIPLILGVLPGFGLLDQAKEINSKIVHAPTMCSLALTLYAAYYTKKCSGIESIHKLDIKRAGAIITALGLYFMVIYLMWIYFGSVGGWGAWYAWFFGHNMDLWIMSLPMVGVPLLLP